MLDDDNDYRCDGCGEPYPKSSLNKINGNYVCDDCAREAEKELKQEPDMEAYRRL